MADTGQERGNAAPNLVDASSDHNLEEAMGKLRVSDGGTERGSGNTAQNVYPDRPGEPNCNFYMRTGTCAYGTNCRYNHPTHIVQGQHYIGELPQREGQPDCQYFIKTGTCRYGATCKYHHPREKLNNRPVYYNSFGLPIREGEKPCPYYMKTGYCKFSTACKFSHPEPSSSSMVYPLQSGGPSSSAVLAPPAGMPLVGGYSGWPVSRAPPYVGGDQGRVQPYVMVQGNVNAGTVGQAGWTTYMQQGNIQPTPSPDLQIPNHQLSNHSPNSPSDNNSSSNLPERPDQPDCQYFIKTGGCKYGPSCKYHHPKERSITMPNQVAPVVGPMGLPLRPGHPVCTYYGMYGTCKYGPSCKYDHPIVPYYNYPVTAFSLPDPYATAYTTDQRNPNYIIANPNIPVEQLGLGFPDEQQGGHASETAPDGPSEQN
ncbi:hypothetical protein LUZ60_002237 [Juncus effusus]|nr:hypothetical protein LUZ60_002237 [Juncus effusus]